MSTLQQDIDQVRAVYGTIGNALNDLAKTMRVTIRAMACVHASHIAFAAMLEQRWQERRRLLLSLSYRTFRRARLR